MYTHTCDICGKVIIGGQYGEYKIRRKRWFFEDSWWTKVDVCRKCEDEMYLYLRSKMKNERLNENNNV